jgi:hypothetical protein
VGKIVTFFFILVTASANADLLLDKDKVFEPIFKEVKNPWVVQGVFELPFYSFYLGAPSVHGVAYLPNFAPRVGPRINFKDLGTTLTFALPIPESEKHRRGDSRLLALVLNSYWHENAIDIYFQKFRGFYMSSPFTELSFHKPDRYPQLPDASVINYGFNWYRVVNPTRYSLKAAFDLTEFQTESGGSWIYNPFFNHFEIFLGDKFVAGSANETQVPPNLASGRFDTVGAAAGYGYTLIHGRLFATAQGALGPALQFQQLQRSNHSDSVSASFSAKLNVNFSAGWNYDEYMGGVKFLLDTLWAEVQGIQVYSSLINAQVFFGHRF